MQSMFPVPDSCFFTPKIPHIVTFQGYELVSRLWLGHVLRPVLVRVRVRGVLGQSKVRVMAMTTGYGWIVLGLFLGLGLMLPKPES